MTMSAREQTYLLSVAKHSIEHGLEKGVQKLPGSYELPEGLQHFENEQACFVTLNKEAQLRGCIGTLEATRALIEDVSHNAFHAAFSDPRFNPLDIRELERLNIGISLLSPPQEMEYCPTMEDLLDQLKPEEDGLIISDGIRRATFLPPFFYSAYIQLYGVVHANQSQNAPRCSFCRSFIRHRPLRVHQFSS